MDVQVGVTGKSTDIRNFIRRMCKYCITTAGETFFTVRIGPDVSIVQLNDVTAKLTC